MKKTKCLLLSLAVAGFAAIAPAQNPQDPRANGMGERFFPMLGRVLTDEQRQSLQQIMESQRDQIQPLMEKIRDSRQAILNEITSGKFDEKAARKYAEQSAQTEAELTMIFAKALSQMQPPLSPGQIGQLKNFPPARFQPQAAQTNLPPLHLALPPPLPQDTNGLPVVK
jgi:Spy/CpxP family protein refolding chaperone